MHIVLLNTRYHIMKDYHKDNTNLVLTHGVEVIKDLMHADHFIVQLIITIGIWQERVTIRDKQVENIHNLQRAMSIPNHFI